MLEYSRLKPVDTRMEVAEDKGTNKLWPVNSFLNENTKELQGSPGFERKEGFSNVPLGNTPLNEEKSVDSKQSTSNIEANYVGAQNRAAEPAESRLYEPSDPLLRKYNGLTLDIPSLQGLMKNFEYNNYGQKPVFTLTPEFGETKTKNDMNQGFGTTSNNAASYGSILPKHSQSRDAIQYKDKKELKEGYDLNGYRSPYIVILGQLSPDMKERLTNENGNSFLELNKPFQFQNEPTVDEKKASEKKGRSSEQVYIVPIDLKNNQQSLKFNHFTDHDREAGHDLNTERDSETEEEQTRTEDSSKLHQANYYRGDKVNPTEYLASWNDKNRKLIKRSKREHSMSDDEKGKLMRLAPMKESVLEGLLGNYLIHD